MYHATRIGVRPKCPMSAYRASAPVMHSTTAPRIRNPCQWCSTMKPERPGRVERLQDSRLPQDPWDSEGGDSGKPDQHHRPEHRADLCGAALLKHEQHHENGQRDRHDERPENRGGNLQSLDGAEDGDRRGDHAVRPQECRTDEAQQDEPELAPLGLAVPLRHHQRQKCQDPAVALVVGARSPIGNRIKNFITI